MSLFEEPHLEPQPEPEKPKKKKLLSIGIGAALIVAVLVTSVVAFSFGQSGKPADNVTEPPQQEEIQTPSDTDTPSDESTDTEKPEDTTPSDSAQETPSTSGKQEIDPSTGKDKYQTDPVPDGKPAPAEPEDAEVDTSTKYTCTISITCKTILDNMDKVKESKKEIVPSDGIILDTTTHSPRAKASSTYCSAPAGSGAYTWNQVGRLFTTVPMSKELRICMSSMLAASPAGCIRSMAGSPTTAAPAMRCSRGMRFAGCIPV